MQTLGKEHESGWREQLMQSPKAGRIEGSKNTKEAVWPEHGNEKQW